MKKKWLTLLVIACMTAAIAGCGSKQEEGEGQSQDTTENALTDKTTVSTKDYDTDALVTVGDFSGLEVEVDNYIFSDADVETRMKSEFASFVDYMDLYDYDPTDKDTVETGDIVNLDYCGKKDDIAFNGGTAKGAHLEIGSKSFIDGFEDGLIGHKVGDSFDLPLTFPKDYSTENLAGQDVIFEITINSIDTKKDPEMTDELIAGMGMEYQTVDTFRDYVKNELQQACDGQNENIKKSQIWSKVYEKCEVKDVPQELIDDAKNRIRDNSQRYADYYGVTVEEFVTQNMGVAMEEYEKQIEDSSMDAAKEKLAIAAVAKKAGISLTDEDVKAVAEEEYAEYGYSSAEEMFADVGSGPYYDYVLQKKVDEYLLKIVKTKNNQTMSIMEVMN